jgi:hypothetical protein
MATTANKWKKARAEIKASTTADGASAGEGPATTKVLALDCEYVGVGLGGVEDMLARGLCLFLQI